MDIFKGIGDFFGGLFGQKKKQEDEQQPQQQQSAVSFNSAPKLGDNFVNNLSNPTQPQQPKEFAKSSVDLNPVKPVQPVQPQPQVNRDQERQQLANKYRQEETDRYNQGSDHAANFLNDIFSGGKTAQMRENTINQNIQNRVNAEMLRKYGPDDQQVKQNIAQTSQNINKNATAVSDFTKNYNNNVQQTVVAPVSAVKGAANSVVETVPKVSGAITELGANTIKLFDEDNQFANNLIKRVRADREKNIVRKTLNDATGLTDQDNKMAYGLGSSGARMAIDASMTPVTGGVAPALVHGVESHSEMMDHLDNIEARKKAEAAAKGEAYTPSSFTSRYLASTANAGAQAAIEKLGIDNLTGKIGGKFAKNMVGRAVTGALGEAGEEGAQQYAENFTKKLFDNKQNIHEGVAESALMGGIMGGAGKMAFGGMESVKNPYKNNNMADGEVSISKLHPDAVLGNTKRNTYYNPKALYEAERNATSPIREKITLAEAERQNRGGDLQYTPRRETNIGRLDSDQLGFTKDELIGKFTGDTRKRMSERSFNMLQDLRANNPYVTGDGQEIYLSGKGNKKFVNTQAGTDAEFIAKMRSTPRINELIQNSKYSHTSPDTKNHGIAPNGFDYRDINFKYGGKDFNTTFNVAKNDTINRNTLYGATTKENISTPGLRDNPSTKSYADVYDSNIAQKDQKVNDFNREYEPEIQDLQNVYQKYGDDFEFNLTPRQQAVYEHLLRESPRDSEGRYIDPVTGEMTIDKIVDRPDGSRYVEIDNNITDGLSNKKDISGAVRKHIADNFQGNQYKVGDTDSLAKVTAKTKAEISHQQRVMNDIDYAIKARMAGNLNDLIETMSDVRMVENKKPRNKLNVSHYLSGRTEVNIDGEVYYPRVDIEVGKNGNVIAYDIADIKKEPRSEQYNDRSYMREANSALDNQGSAYGSNIAQNDQKVNRMRPFEPTEHTPLSNGDRDFGGSFGNGFNPRGENSTVNKAAFPKVQEEDLATPELEKYGIKPTKTEYNQALEYVLMEERPELFERYEKARLGLESLEENIEFNQFTPTELERLYGKNYAEHLDRGMISQMVRKDSVNGLDQAAMRGDMSEVDMEDYIDRLNNYYETKREVKDLEQEIREAYADPELREDAKQALWFNKYEEIENAVANLRQNGVDIDFDGYVQLKYGNKAENKAVKTEEKPNNEDIIDENIKTDKNIASEAPLIKETDQKTRKFAETVLDTDTPPKDFVKLMHAGDESLKYTPKKNSELWNKATKSVQESPERVFNELENTRVANDETMAKGIALAKHYQAMGDDLKASELYVELAKKATEAGRTVQALNLMRRTTPEGVLMSTMREVERYNDKMKDKPNKQINITPEQRAEFLGKLREAYAMPEGNLKEIRARRIAIGEAIREVRDQIPSSKWDKFTTLWKAGLLTAPTTHIRNIAGNVINGGSEKVAQTVGSAFDWMISKGTGKAYNFLRDFINPEAIYTYT